MGEQKKLHVNLLSLPTIQSMPRVNTRKQSHKDWTSTCTDEFVQPIPHEMCAIKLARERTSALAKDTSWQSSLKLPT